MKKTIYFILFLFVAGTLLADWDPGDGHKMHYPQLPDPLGWDVALYEEPLYLADDWQCSETGYVCWIHFWISYHLDLYEEIAYIHLSIHDDVPAGEDPLFTWSHPGALRWSYDLQPGEFTIREPEMGDQGWFNPWWDIWEESNHMNYFQINTGTICDFTDPFYQIEGEIYWLDIAIYLTSGSEGIAGWKTTLDHWNDDAVFWWQEGMGMPPPGPPGVDGWYELIDPITSESLDMAFVIDGIDDPACPVELSSFSTSFINGNAILNWTTQSETNNLGWNIYRGETETALQNNTTFCLNNSGLILGAGTTSVPTNYQFTDEYDVIVNQTYWYWLETVDGAGGTVNYGPVTLTVPEEEPIPQLPQNTFLCSNYPNPFNPSTFIEFSIKEGETGKLTIYNAKGQVIETRTYEAGSDYYEWDGTEYGSGIYFYKLETQSYTETKKMIMLK